MFTDNINLIEEMGLAGLPRERCEELVEKMREVIEDRICSRLLALLSESDKRTFDKLMDADADMPEVLAFFRSSIPNLTAEIAQVVADFRTEMLDLNAIARSAINKNFK